MDNEQIKTNVTSGKQWIRLIYMVLFAVALYFASIVMWIVVVLQFLFALFTGKDNDHLRGFGYSLSTYLYDVYKFLTYSSEEKPFPFSDWPESPADLRDSAEPSHYQSPQTPVAPVNPVPPVSPVSPVSATPDVDETPDTREARARQAFQASDDVIDDGTHVDFHDPESPNPNNESPQKPS